MHWQRWFSEAQLGIGWDSSSLPQSASEHVLVAAVQMRPVGSVHALFPQKQAALLGADPSVFLQAGAVRVHMHVLKVLQDVVEEVSVLKYREPSEVL